MKKINKDIAFAWSEDNENWNGPFSTMEECLNEAEERVNNKDARIYVVTFKNLNDFVGNGLGKSFFDLVASKIKDSFGEEAAEGFSPDKDLLEWLDNETAKLAEKTVRKVGFKCFLIDPSNVDTKVYELKEKKFVK